MNLQNSNSSTDQALGLLDLDDDILSLIISLLLTREGSQNALAISLVCRRLRTISLFFLFRVVRWPREGRTEFYPRALWPYMRHLYYLQVQWRSHHLKSLETLSDALPHLQNLITFGYSDQKFGPSLTFIESLARSLPFDIFELSTTFFSHEALASFTKFYGIQRLIVKQQSVALATAPESKRLLSLQCVANLIFACSGTLSYMEIPGEFFPFEAFASRPVKMSALKTLILNGYPPLKAQGHCIWKLSPSFPLLSKIEILFKLRVIGAHPSRYSLMSTELPPEQNELCIFPPLLDSLSIANPMMEDRIFLHLPPFLTSLNLDFIPEWENMLLSKDILAYHKPERMRSFLYRIKRAHGPLPDLKVLCIKMGWCATPDIMMCIGHLFPGLTYLEFQGLRYVDRTEEPHSDMDGSVSNLANLQDLQTLKLAVELPEDPYQYSATAERDVGSVEQAASKWAEILALRLPKLRLLAFEKRPHVGRSLGPRVLLGHSDWIWFDIKKGIAKRQAVVPDESMQKSRARAEIRYRHHLQAMENR